MNFFVRNIISHVQLHTVFEYRRVCLCLNIECNICHHIDGDPASGPGIYSLSTMGFEA